MTDRPNAHDHRSPAEEDGATPAPDDARRLRRHLDAAVAAPVPDAWEQIRARSEDGATAVRLDRHAAPRHLSHRMLVAAAAVLVVVVGAVAVLATRGNDDSGRDRVQTPAEGPTGFYIPGDLPDDWQLRDVSATHMDQPLPCPCTITTFRGEGGSYGTIESAATGADVWMTGPERLGWADGTYDPGLPNDPSATRAAAWTIATEADGAGTRVLLSGGLDEATFLALAERWGDRPGAEPAALAGYAVTDTRTIEAPVRKVSSVRWTFERPGTQQRIGVSLTSEPFAGLGHGERVTLPGNGLEAFVATAGATVSVAATWPGHAGLFVRNVDASEAEPDAEPAAGHVPVSQETIEAVLGSFRPVDRTEWGAYVADRVPIEPGAPSLATESIDDWLRTGPPTIIRGTEEGDESSLLTVLEPEPATAPFGTSVEVTVGVVNDTGRVLRVRGCLNGAASLWLVDAEGRDRSGSNRSVSCSGEMWDAEPGERREIALSASLKDVKPGRYTAIVILSDVDVILRVPVTVT
jgi:hypothetical protein